jgi:hypothetical protein
VLGDFDEDQQFLVRAGPGGFVCRWAIGKDMSLGVEALLIVHVRMATWLADDMFTRQPDPPG